MSREQRFKNKIRETWNDVIDDGRGKTSIDENKCKCSDGWKCNFCRKVFSKFANVFID